MPVLLFSAVIAIFSESFFSAVCLEAEPAGGSSLAMVNSFPPPVSDPHRHHHVAVNGSGRSAMRPHLSRAIGIFEMKLYFGLVHRAQKIEQVKRIEANLHLRPAIFHRKRLFAFAGF